LWIELVSTHNSNHLRSTRQIFLTSERHFAWGLTLLLTIGAFVYMEWIALTQWLSGRWYLADVGNIHYCLFNTWYDGFMNSPLMGHNNHFAFHFTPFLLVLAPLVLLSVYPVPLVTSYVVALALCVPAVHLLAARSGVRGLGCVALAWLFLSNHFVGSLELANHFEVFYVLFAIVAIALRMSRWMWVAAVLAITVKEDAALWIGAWAAFEWWNAQSPTARRRWGRLVAVAGIYLLIAAATMLFLQHRLGRGALTDYAGRFRGFAPSWDTLSMIALLVASFAFLPIFAGRRSLLCLIPLPMILASFPFMRHLLYYYSYPFLPFLAYASVLGYRRVVVVAARRGQRWVAHILSLVVFAVGAIQWALPTRTDGYRRTPFEVTTRDWYRIELARTRLPRQGPLALQFGLWGITPHRLDTHMLCPAELAPSDWVFMDLQSPHGQTRDEFIRVARQVMQDVEAGRREALHTAYDIFIVSPVKRTQEEAP
jgi:uncharacterized membrane protein